MTRKQWKEILEELKTMRSTNKFREEIVYYSNTSRVHRELNTGAQIDKINVDEECIRFAGRVYIRHADVIDMKPEEMRARFFVTMNAFKIDKVKFRESY